MELKINITTCTACDDCKVTVKDLSEYLSEESTGIVKGKFKFSETGSIDVLQLNKTSETLYLNPTYTDHSKVQDSTLQIS